VVNLGRNSFLASVVIGIRGVAAPLTDLAESISEEKQNMKTESFSHCHGESSFHIVFSPKYRHDIFEKEQIKAFCEKTFNEIALKESFVIRALKMVGDHVHLFVSIPPKYSVSDTVQRFKGYSAYRLFQEFPWLKQYKYGEKRFWGGHFWSRGYFFRSVGSTTDEAVEFYIKITQDKQLREKYYTTVGSMDKKTTAEDPYVEFLRNQSKYRKSKTNLHQKNLSSFFR
jgi:putative transposase